MTSGLTMYCTLDTQEKKSAQAVCSTQFPATSGSLSVLEELEDEVRFSNSSPSGRRSGGSKKKCCWPSSLSPRLRRRRRHCARPSPRRRLWPKDLICSLVFGEKTLVGVRPSLEKKELIGFWNQDLQLPKLANYRLEDHFKGVQTYYFFGTATRR